MDPTVRIFASIPVGEIGPAAGTAGLRAPKRAALRRRRTFAEIMASADAKVRADEAAGIVSAGSDQAPTYRHTAAVRGRIQSQIASRRRQWARWGVRPR